MGAGFAAGVAIIAFRYTKQGVDHQERIANNLGRLVTAVESLSQQLTAFQESVKRLEESLEREREKQSRIKSVSLKRAQSAASLMTDDDDMFDTAEEDEPK